MKKRSFGMVLLISVLIIVIVFYLLINSALNKGDDQAPAPTGDVLYIDRSASEVVKLTYRTGGAEFSVVKKGAVYVLDEDESFPLDTSAVNFMTNAAAKILVQRKINPEGNDLSEYGLGDPRTVIDVVYEDGAALKLNIGNYNAYTEGYYCSVGDGFVYLFGGDFIDAFAYTYSDLILDDHVQTPQNGFSSLTSIEITSGDKTVIYECVSDGDDLLFTKTGAEGDFSDEAQDIYYELFHLGVGSWVDYNVQTEEKFDQYGLKDPYIRIVFKHIETEEITVEGSSTVIKEHERQTAFLIGDLTDKTDDDCTERYFAFGGGTIIYVLDEENFGHTLGALE